MKKISLFLLLFLALISAPGFKISSAQAAVYTISGYIKDQNGSGVASTTIIASEAQTDADSCPIGPPALSTAVSDASGYYSLTITAEPGLGWGGICNYVKLSITKAGCTFVSPARFQAQSTAKDIGGTCAGAAVQSISFARTAQTSISSPFKAGDSTAATFQFYPWSYFQGKDWALKSKTTDTVTGAVTNDADFLASWSDIAAQSLC